MLIYKFKITTNVFLVIFRFRKMLKFDDPRFEVNWKTCFLLEFLQFDKTCFLIC